MACSAAPAQQPDRTAARVGNRTITTKELDDRWRADDPASQADATQKLYDGRRAALDAIIADMLLAEAAKKKGMTAEAYELEEVGKRVKPVTDAEVVAFYQANINQMQGRPLEVMAPAINRYLTEQQRATARQGADRRAAQGRPRRARADRPAAPRRGHRGQRSRRSAARRRPVTLIEFSDFQCPFCQRVAPTLKQVRETYGDKVRIVWKDFPLTQIHPQAFKAGEAAHCAGDQGKFWEYHDRLFANQQPLQPEDLKKHATDLGLDARGVQRVSRHRRSTVSACATASPQGTRLGVNSTPTIYINGRMLSGAQPYETFVSVIDEELSRAK